MIPKIIHYCWFSGTELPPFLKDCIATWKQYLPDYQIRIWDQHSFDFSTIPFVKEAYEAKKWAYVTDYIRFYALHTEGGLYMDSDVKVLKTFKTEWHSYDFYSSHEMQPHQYDSAKLNDLYLPKNPNEIFEGITIQGAIMASKKGHPFVKECMDWYASECFLNEKGVMRDVKEIIIGQVLARIALRYGYVYRDKEQILHENMLIMPSNILVGNAIHLSSDSYAIHLVNGSWVERNKYESLLYNIRNNQPKIFPLFSFLDKVLRKIKVI